MKKNTKLHIGISSQDKESLKKDAQSLGLEMASLVLLLIKKRKRLLDLLEE